MAVPLVPVEILELLPQPVDLWACHRQSRRRKTFCQEGTYVPIPGKRHGCDNKLLVSPMWRAKLCVLRQCQGLGSRGTVEQARRIRYSTKLQVLHSVSTLHTSSQ